MIGLLVLLLPIVELIVIVEVAVHIGVLNTIALLIVISMVGGWLVKREGLGVLRRLQVTVADGQVPHRELIDGFLLLVAGVLLMVPGFVTDVPGVLLLLPPVRALVRGAMARSLRKRTSFAVRVVDGFGRVDIRGGNVRDVSSRDVSSRDVSDPPVRGELEG